MAKKEPQITVTTVFDGGLQAKDIFADLIIEKKKCRSLKESTSVQLQNEMQKLSNDFSKKDFLKVQGFCTFNIYHETGRRKSRRHQERVPRILQMFGYLAVTFSLLLKKATHNNRKQHKATIDSNTKQHHNKSVRGSVHGSSNSPDKSANSLWPKIGQTLA